MVSADISLSLEAGDVYFSVQIYTYYSMTVQPSLFVPQKSQRKYFFKLEVLGILLWVGGGVLLAVSHVGYIIQYSSVFVRACNVVVEFAKVGP
jgi:hypothetical protein